MEILISVRHCNLSEAVKQHATDAIEAAFSEFRLRIGKVTMVLDMQRNTVKATISVAIKDYPVSAASECFDNVYKAIDEAVSKAEVQARKYLDKKQDHRADGLAAAEAQKVEE